jgi:hypothetical protein
MMLNASIMTGKRLEDTVGGLVKVRIKPAHFHEVAIYLPIKIDYSANTVFEVRDVGGYWLLHGKVFHKRVFDIVEEEDMARDNITDKSSPPKSEWFGYKYRVTPETSKLLQEAVFADGGGWYNGNDKTLIHLNEVYLLVNKEGCITYTTDEEIFDSKGFPEKQPPLPKEFKVGKWYKCIKADISYLEHGKYYQLSREYGGGLMFEGILHTCFHPSSLDVNSESSFDPNVKETVDTGVKDSSQWHKYSINVSVTGYLSDTITPVTVKFNQQEDVNMSTQRKVVEVQLFDDAKGLPVQDSLVAKFDNVLTEDDSDTTIREVIMNNDIKRVLAAHNVKRSKVINQDILERTGNSVPLQPILLKDLRWKVIG